MLRNLFFMLVFNLLSLFVMAQEDDSPVALVIHGGAGVILKKNMTEEKEAAYTAKLQEALDSGYAILKRGGTSREAVVATIMILEDSPLFNAGKGAVFTNAETNEMDASIMDGNTREAGAVAGVSTVKNPILVAQAVLEHSPHVLLTGKGAETFAASQDIEQVEPSYFRVERRLEQLRRIKADEPRGDYQDPAQKAAKFGTVGAVALDKDGNITAATSTGGMTNKRYGRVGDSPIIGAGTFADNNTCGVSCTGHGEYFMRYLVAYDIAALMAYKGYSLKKACREVVMKKLKKAGGSGGVIALDAEGNIAMTFNSPGMFRAYRNPKGKSEVLIYK